MIVSFSVSNFRSFHQEQTLNLVASNKIADHRSGHLSAIPGSDEKVLRAAVLYGANGAGKSNLFRAVQFLRSLALRTRERDARLPRSPFRLGDDSGGVTEFDIQFVANEKLYRYGCRIDDLHVLDEWLLDLSRARKRLLFERTTDPDGSVRVVLGPGTRNDSKLQAMVQIGGRRNQTFLSGIESALEPDDQVSEIRNVLQWWDTGLVLIGPSDSYPDLDGRLANDAAFAEFASSYLRNSTTGVDRIRAIASEISEAEFRALLPREFPSDLLEKILTQSGPELTEEVGINVTPGTVLKAELRGGKKFTRTVIQSEHLGLDGSAIPFEIQEESDGTRRLLNLTPSLFGLSTEGGCYFIDEIDRSLHPLLVREFVDFFLRKCAGSNRQLLVTTHETGLLDQDLLRRDEIWFAEKDPRGATHLYSLLDFKKVRKDLELRKGYLQGRFGAIPFLGGMESLLASSEG